MCVVCIPVYPALHTKLMWAQSKVTHPGSCSPRETEEASRFISEIVCALCPAVRVLGPRDDTGQK